ncbi:MAG: hypothetical protein JWQ81_1594 [Amycolatopsis sp.]|uniref:hypothetical protein n=1 Tax=Amycolatopsis sp. TaxID=37632 RepID=UPI0026282023|nr:hypothetical protein [Amycolatopsis sp.]MCU1680855.1 hypothetical protein [Amycolatopsis sp.]
MWILTVLLTPLITGVPFGLYFKVTFDSSKNETGVAVAAMMAIPVIVLGVLPVTAWYMKFKRDLKKGLIPMPGMQQPYPMQTPQQGYPRQGYPQPGQTPGYPPQQPGAYPPPPPPLPPPC